MPRTGLALFSKLLTTTVIPVQELPKVGAHFDRECVHPIMFCSHWFNTVFSYSLPFEHLLRVWDVFLFEGWKIIFRVGLLLLKSTEEQLLARSFEGLMGILNSNSKQLSAAQFPALGSPPDSLIKVVADNGSHHEIECMKQCCDRRCALLGCYFYSESTLD